MPRSFKFPRKLEWKGVAIKDPRVAMRAAIGVLLAANLAAAVMAFNVFGGSAEDLRRQRETLRGQLAQLQGRLATSKRLVDKVDTARQQGDQFLAKYVIDQRTLSSVILEELTRVATQSGIKMGQVQIAQEPVEGSDTLAMVTIQAGFEGPYANLAKLINLLDKSPRFLIIENMQANAPQAQGSASASAPAGQLSVTLKIDAFVRNAQGAA
jgi:Type II secretion system (T2SS), protein M subtype b